MSLSLNVIKLFRFVKYYDYQLPTLPGLMKKGGIKIPRANPVSGDMASAHLTSAGLGNSLKEEVQ